MRLSDYVLKFVADFGVTNVFLVTGGGAMYLNQSLGADPIKFLVLNNDGYSSIRASQKAYFGSANIGADKNTGITIPDLSKLRPQHLGDP
jgi:thiamine pyrophosphate-dependent acetolactate synthase large subunit-like protein